ncbi:hypothetical protein DPMN_025902 [Dreissena polymorpha]|uniref:Uncharacterized protein n=1 Tax=Dreissena polymorpha TaxID=45954 RepID=A0A9D4LQ34_DREPO|nr:hypothetical protein DPMN_025902 [Dreissena polymorpha]
MHNVSQRERERGERERGREGGREGGRGSGEGGREGEGGRFRDSLLYMAISALDPQ